MDLEYSKAVGAAIRAARLARGMTQEQLSAKAQPAGCDLTRSALAKSNAASAAFIPMNEKRSTKRFRSPMRRCCNDSSSLSI